MNQIERKETQEHLKTIQKRFLNRNEGHMSEREILVDLLCTTTLALLSIEEHLETLAHKNFL